MSLSVLATLIQQEIENAVRTVVQEMLQLEQLFASLPEICDVPELARFYGVSEDIIYRDGAWRNASHARRTLLPLSPSIASRMDTPRRKPGRRRNWNRRLKWLWKQ